jgi:hypothetical protein
MPLGIVFHHRVHDDQEFSYSGDQRRFLNFSSIDQLAAELLDFFDYTG